MTLRKGLPAKNAATDADDTRLVFRNLFACDAEAEIPWSGVTSPVGVPLVSSTSGMAVTVAPFNAVVKRDGGVVMLANEGPATVPIQVAPASNARIDVVCARQNDSSSTVSAPDSDDEPELIVIAGVSDVNPVKPLVPEGSVELATVLVPAGVTAMNAPGVIVTQTAMFAAASGSPIPVRSSADRDVLKAFQGMRVLNLATGCEEKWLDTYSPANLGGATPAGWYPVSGNLPDCSVLSVKTQTMPASVWTLIAAAWGSPISTMGTFSAGILTVDRPGLYDIDLSIFIASLGSIQRIGCQVTKNSAVADVGVIAKGLVGSQNTVATFARKVPLAAGDRLRAFASGSSSDITIQPANAPSQLSVRYVSPAQ